MAKPRNPEARQRALAAVRDYGVELTLFRNAMSDWAGLSVTAVEGLRYLFLKGVATPTDLARHTGLTSGATTAMLDRLEEAGLIERRPNPADRRGVLVAPVASAAGRMASWFASAREAQAELLSRYTEKELELIADVFERFVRLWEAERAKVQRARPQPGN